MEEDPELEKLFNDWKIEEEENLRYIERKNRKFAQNIKTTKNIIKIVSYAKYIRYLMIVLYAYTLKYLIFNNKSLDPYILIIYHYIVFTTMVYSRFLSKNVKLKILTNILKKIK
jgi:hypothetical protein